MKSLIVYYSYRGNTKRIAEAVQQKIGGDILRIETVVPYGNNYNQIVNQGQEEVNRGYCPKIKDVNVDWDQYDTIILGTPVWWYTFAPAMHTFLKAQDWKGKTVYPFATNGGWIGHTFKDFDHICKGADVKAGLNVRFDETTLRTSMKEIDNWISKIAKN